MQSLVNTNIPNKVGLFTRINKIRMENKSVSSGGLEGIGGGDVKVAVLI